MPFGWLTTSQSIPVSGHYWSLGPTHMMHASVYVYVCMWIYNDYIFVENNSTKSSIKSSNNSSITSMKSTNTSLHTQVNYFLQHVKEKFSKVLIPVEEVTKLELIGKGICFSYVHMYMYSTSKTICKQKHYTLKVTWGCTYLCTKFLSPWT